MDLRDIADESLLNLINAVNPEIDSLDYYSLPNYSLKAQCQSDIYRFCKLDNLDEDLADTLYNLILYNAQISADIPHDEHRSNSEPL